MVSLVQDNFDQVRSGCRAVDRVVPAHSDLNRGWRGVGDSNRKRDQFADLVAEAGDLLADAQGLVPSYSSIDGLLSSATRPNSWFRYSFHFNMSRLFQLSRQNCGLVEHGWHCLDIEGCFNTISYRFLLNSSCVFSANC
jgi:hypothetical protein